MDLPNSGKEPDGERPRGGSRPSSASAAPGRVTVLLQRALRAELRRLEHWPRPTAMCGDSWIASSSRQVRDPEAAEGLVAMRSDISLREHSQRGLPLGTYPQGRDPSVEVRAVDLVPMQAQERSHVLELSRGRPELRPFQL